MGADDDAVVQRAKEAALAAVAGFVVRSDTTDYSETVRVDAYGLARLVCENVHQKGQIDDLQRRGTELLDETRAQRMAAETLCDPAEWKKVFEKALASLRGKK